MAAASKNKPKLPESNSASVLVDHGYGTRFQKFQYLMRLRIRDVLIVSSPYDLYVFEEDGRLYEMLRDNYQHLNLSHVPEFTRVSNGEEAVSLLREVKRFDLVIVTMHIEGMSPYRLAQRIQDEGLKIPVVLLSFDYSDLLGMSADQEKLFDQVFTWQGDYRLLLAMIKSLEDRLNVDNDTRLVGVNSIIVVEDDVRSYSTFLPMVYTEVMHQSQHLLSDEIGLTQKKIRQRARPKILLCKNYEQAWECFEQYQETILGVISDVDFPVHGRTDSQAGFALGRAIRERNAELPLFFHSVQTSNQEEALRIGNYFVRKGSPRMEKELRSFMSDSLGFGDFIFRLPDGKEVARARDLNSLEQQLATVPDDSFVYHAERNHFSRWLKARTEFWLADQLRPRKISDFASIEDTRNHLIASIRIYRQIRQRGIITDFRKEKFDPETSFSRVGSGSLGGKARGLSFVNILINNYKLQDRFEHVRVFIPPGIVIGAGVFDQFIELNDLLDFAISTDDDEAIVRTFIEAERFPEDVQQQLAEFLTMVETPLAVRSSSLLEDSHSHPFAGVYETYMIPNTGQILADRVAMLLNAVKRVYASLFLQNAKQYFRMTPFKIEDEKMAVIVQKLVGSVHNDRFYPTFSGVAQSYNYYPVPPQTFEDGVISLAHGLGKMVVEGGRTLRFCPKFPNRIDQLATPKLALQNNQHEFYAMNLKLAVEKECGNEDYYVCTFPIQEAEKDGSLQYTASTYSPDNDRIMEGLSIPGIRLITFAPVLKHGLLPLTEIVNLLLEMGRWGMGTAVEIEFSVDMQQRATQPVSFGLLQMRPMVLHRELEAHSSEDVAPDRLLCRSHRILGNGILRDIHDIVIVDKERFDRSKTAIMAQEIAQFNTQLINENRRYLLIGLGRWGSLDPWMGIPVRWSHIAGAGAIIEAGFDNFKVEPSQGSHFFQNLISFSMGYFTVFGDGESDFLDWEWLGEQEALAEAVFTRHLRFAHPLTIRMNGRANTGLIIKPT